VIHRCKQSIRDAIELWSRGVKTFQAAKAARFLELLDYLENLGPGPEIYADLFMDELWLKSVQNPRRGTVEIAIDWQDYGQVQDDTPIMHYRMRVRPGVKKLSIERRTRKVEEVGQFLSEVLE
jgi:hypothetical protein